MDQKDACTALTFFLVNYKYDDKGYLVGNQNSI